MDVINKLKSLKIEHYHCENSWYSCPLAEGGCTNTSKLKGMCDCNATEHNALVDLIIFELEAYGFK